MKHLTIILVFGLFLGFSSCENNTNEKQSSKVDDKDVKVSYIYQKDKTFNTIKKKGAAIAIQTQVELGKALKAALEKGGPENAIEFCNLEALRITDSIASSEEVIVKRLAKKNRNPKNEMDEVESKIFKQYIFDYLNKRNLDPRIALNSEGHPVYYKPIITNNMCLTCHGTPGSTMSNDLAGKIREIYPDDKAINFEDGQPRGMWAITFTKINVNPEGVAKD